MSRSISEVATETMPPSPEVMFFVGYSENIAKEPKAPTGVPCSDAPWAWAASS